MQTTIAILSTLPWSFKLVFGFISDLVPIFGLHRKPYFTLGAIIYSLASFYYATSEVDDVVFLAISIFTSTLGMIMFDVMADTMVGTLFSRCPELLMRNSVLNDLALNQMRFKDRCNHRIILFDLEVNPHLFLLLKSSSYLMTGSLLGSVLGAIVSNKESWGWGLTFKQVLMINGCVPFFLVCPFLFTLREKYRKVPLSLYEGASSEMELPVDERIPLHDNLNSPRARSDNYLVMTKTSSTPDLRGASSRQRMQRENDLIMMALSNSNGATGTKQGYGTYQRKSYH